MVNSNYRILMIVFFPFLIFCMILINPCAEAGNIELRAIDDSYEKTIEKNETAKYAWLVVNKDDKTAYIVNISSEGGKDNWHSEIPIDEFLLLPNSERIVHFHVRTSSTIDGDTINHVIIFKCTSDEENMTFSKRINTILKVDNEEHKEWIPGFEIPLLIVIVAVLIVYLRWEKTGNTR